MGFGLDIGFIDHVNTQLIITLNYSAVADFHTLPNHAKSFPGRSVFTSSCLFLYSLNGGSFPMRIQSQSQSQSHIVTDGQSLSKSWCRAPIWAHDQIFFTVWHLPSCFCGAPSLTRGRVCHLYMLLALASAVFLGRSPLGLAPIFYCLRFETSLFVASYDSQGHGGGIRPRLHTGYAYSWFNCPYKSVYTDRVENTIANSTSIVAFIFDTERTCLSSRCLKQLYRLQYFWAKNEIDIKVKCKPNY
jgi:hypothetical protein